MDIVVGVYFFLVGEDIGIGSERMGWTGGGSVAISSKISSVESWRGGWAFKTH